MRNQTPQLHHSSDKKPANNSLQNKKVFLLLVLLSTVVGIFFIASALLNPHKAGIVTNVGRISIQTSTSGTGRNRSKRSNYAADVKVRDKITSEIVTVYYRVRNVESIPETGDEIQFGYSLVIGGYTPYPQMWAVWTGVFLLGLSAILFGGYLIGKQRKNRTEALLDNAENNSI